MSGPQDWLLRLTEKQLPALSLQASAFLGREEVCYRQMATLLLTFIFVPIAGLVSLSSAPPPLLGKDLISCSQSLVDIRVLLAGYALAFWAPPPRILI